MCLKKALLAILPIVAQALANVEKTIFIAPEAIPIPPGRPSLSDLSIPTLTHDNSSIRIHITAKFPTESSPSGVATWLLLGDLNPGQRYEVRICWAATQPTAFTLDAYELESVWDSPELITSLAEYASSRRLEQPPPPPDAPAQAEQSSSVLLLRVLAAADYFTHKEDLMERVPEVHVDIILDPFLFNVLPRSLLPTVGYILVFVPVAWFVARAISNWIQSLAGKVNDERESKKSR